MGLVDRRPNRGAIVAVVTQEHLSSMFESMAELEGICARFSAERMTPGERRALEREHGESARLVHLGAEEDYEAHNTEFHTRLYRGAHSKHIYELVTMTRSRLAPFRRAQFRLPGRLAKSWDEHDAIVTAIMRGDAGRGRRRRQGTRLHRQRGKRCLCPRRTAEGGKYDTGHRQLRNQSLPNYTTWRKTAGARACFRSVGDPNLAGRTSAIAFRTPEAAIPLPAKTRRPSSGLTMSVVGARSRHSPTKGLGMALHRGALDRIASEVRDRRFAKTMPIWKMRQRAQPVW